MAGYKPYKENYFPQRKKKNTLIIGGLFLLMILAGIFFLSRHKSPDTGVKKEEPLKLDNRGVKKEIPVQNQNFPEDQIKDNQSLVPEYGKDDLSNKDQTGSPESSQATKRTYTIEKQQEEEWQSDIDLKREQGIIFFEEVILRCSETRGQINELQAEYNNSCYGIIYDAFGNPINKAMTEECVKLMNEIKSLKTELGKNLEMARENARKSGVYPGQIRDILTQYEFEDQ